MGNFFFFFSFKKSTPVNYFFFFSSKSEAILGVFFIYVEMAAAMLSVRPLILCCLFLFVYGDDRILSLPGYNLDPNQVVTKFYTTRAFFLWENYFLIYTLFPFFCSLCIVDTSMWMLPATEICSIGIFFISLLNKLFFLVLTTFHSITLLLLHFENCFYSVLLLSLYRLVESSNNAATSPLVLWTNGGPVSGIIGCSIRILLN